MELLTLDGNYQPANLVERYGSLIWTERYATPGDFQLVTTDVERMIKLLPRETLVTIRESTVPMMIENHKIEKKINGPPIVTITGRSFESVLERRATLKLDVIDEIIPIIGNKSTWVEAANMPSNAAYYAIRRTIGDDGDRRTQAQIDAGQLQLRPQFPWHTGADGLPMVDLPLPADFVYIDFDEALPSQLYEIKPGNLYTVALELIHSNHHGLKSVRPAIGENKIAIEIYNGANLTEDVVFDAKFDQFEGSTYLLSEAGSTNIAYVVSKTGFEAIPKNTLDESEIPSGLNRRVVLVDLTGEDDVGVDTPETRKTRGLIELYKHNATALFEGQVSEQVATSYNREGGYFLGDIIRLDGEYGLSQNVRVAEFIRSDDSTGSKAYPTFELVTE